MQSEHRNWHCKLTPFYRLLALFRKQQRIVGFTDADVSLLCRMWASAWFFQLLSTLKRSSSSILVICWISERWDTIHIEEIYSRSFIPNNGVAICWSLTQNDKIERGVASCCQGLTSIPCFVKLRRISSCCRVDCFLRLFTPPHELAPITLMLCHSNSFFHRTIYQKLLETTFQRFIWMSRIFYTALKVIWNINFYCLKNKNVFTIIPITLYPPLGCQDTLMKLEEEVVKTLLLTSPVNLNSLISTSRRLREL